MNPIERRDFLKGTATGVFAFTVGAVEVWLSPREARAQGVPFRLLKADEAQTIEALGETLVPGARAAGVAHFVDQQLSAPPEEALLEARILNVRPPYANFYRAAVDAVDSASQTLNGGRKFAQLSPSEQHDFVDAMRQNKIQGRRGPGGPFVYLVLRSDAVDVVYGTMEGYEALGIPYMPHIAPQKEVVTMATNEKVDVVVLGAGASGSVYAAVMARQDKKVVVLEQGPDWRLSDLISSDIWGRRVKPAGGPFILEGKHPVSYGYQAGWGVGGAALHYFANFPRLLPNDFKIKSEHNRAHDWPISYEDVAPYYDKVARDVGVSGDAKAEEIWRPAGEHYPMPPMKTFRNGQVWLKGFETVGIRMVPAAVGMNSTEYKGRAACIYDGWCHVGCPIGALANPLVTYLADAKKTGAEVRPWSTVTRVLTTAEGTRVTGVEYYDQKKERQEQPASAVVLAAWAAQNPRILLNSATDKHPKGLANSSGLVGKYMMTHFISGTLAIFDEDVENHMGTTGAQYMSYDRYGKTSHKDGFGSSFIVAGFALKTNDLGGIANARVDLFGADLHDFMIRAKRGLTRIGSFGEELPNIENRIELVSDKDEFGMPLAKIIHTYDGDAEAIWNANFEEGLKIAKAAGAKEVWSARGTMPTIHLMGGTIMGTEAGNSVVNSYGQTHEISNLYVAGPGIFATSGASNPTYTIFALSLRGAEQLAENWATVAG